jgi:phage gp29-like protein
MILDAYGRPVKFEALTEVQAGPTLTGIRNIYSTIDTSIGLTPARIAGVLRQAEYGDPWLFLELAERMEEKDELYQGLLHTRKMAVSQLDIAITPASPSAADVNDAAFVEEVLLQGELDLHERIFDILDALGKGFSATEIIWDTHGRNFRTGTPQWIPVELKWRDPRWFMFDWISGEQLLVRSLRTDGSAVPSAPMGDGQPLLNPLNLRIADADGQQIGFQPATRPLSPFKFITHITKAKAGLPIRGGLARVAMWNYLFRNYILKDYVAFCEVFGQPLRSASMVPARASRTNRCFCRR